MKSSKKGMSAIKIRPKLIELWTRLVQFDEKADIYINGYDNLYPNEMERAVMNSPTASRCANMMSKFIAGTLVGEDPVVNVRKNLRLSDIIKEMARSLSVQNGFFLHIGYGLGNNGWEPNRLTVLDYIKCRIAKEDDEKFPGRIWYDDWESEKSVIRRWRGNKKNTNTEKSWFFPYNPNQDVIQSQIEMAGNGDVELGIKNYRGQVLYVNLTPTSQYAVSKFDPVYNDCDTEYRMSLYANSMTRGGFLGKVAVLTQGLDEEKARQVESDISKWLGAENSSHIYHLDVENTESLENVLKIIQVPTQYDDDMFVNTDKRIRRNISGVANNIPEPLIYASEGALFGTSGEKYREMKDFYTEQTKEERMILERTVKGLGFDVRLEAIDWKAELENEIVLE